MQYLYAKRKPYDRDTQDQTKRKVSQREAYTPAANDYRHYGEFCKRTVPLSTSSSSQFNYAYAHNF